jgi:hypothetical protein
LASRSHIQSSSSTFHDIAIEDDSNHNDLSLFDYYTYDHVDDDDDVDGGEDRRVDDPSRTAVDDDNIGGDVDDESVSGEYKCRNNLSLSRENVSLFEVSV